MPNVTRILFVPFQRDDAWALNQAQKRLTGRNNAATRGRTDLLRSIGLAGDEYDDKDQSWIAVINRRNSAFPQQGLIAKQQTSSEPQQNTATINTNAQQAPQPAQTKTTEMVNDDPSDGPKIVTVTHLRYDGKPHPEMQKLRDTDQVYIRGHCLPTLEKIFTGDLAVDTRLDDQMLIKDLTAVYAPIIGREPSPAAYLVLDADQVVARLIASGLLPAFAGKIKCYNCHSALPPEGRNFSRTLVTKLRKEGYNACTVFGYTGALDSFPGANAGEYKETIKTMDEDDATTLHKHVVPPRSNDPLNRKIDSFGRASKNRREAIPYEE
jgi:hypothetical protein